MENNQDIKTTEIVEDVKDNPSLEEKEKETKENTNPKSKEEENNDDVEVDAEFTDGDEGSDNDLEEKEKDSKTKEELEKRSRFAQQRREREAREKEVEKIRQEAYRKAMIDAVDRTNPYTNEKIDDEHDIEEYLTMREIEKAGLDPIADYHKYLKQKAREERNKTNFNTSRLTNEQIKEDAILFQKTYPKVNIGDLQNDARFLKFSEGKLDVLPLTKVYGDYLEFTKEFETEVEKKARRIAAKMKSSPGPVDTSTESKDGEFYTFDQIQKMSQAEVEKNFDKVQASLQRHYKQMNK